jgi:formylglycine-generating enzyme required for sulfatase activity
MIFRSILRFYISLRMGWIFGAGSIGILAFVSPVPESPGAEAMYKQDSVLYRIHTTRASLENIIKAYGTDFQRGAGYIRDLDEIQTRYLSLRSGNQKEGINEAYKRLISLQKTALLSSPVIDFDDILLVNRKIDLTDWDKIIQTKKIIRFGFPSNHECNSSLPRNGFENELTILTGFKDGGNLKTVFKPADHGYAGEMDLHWEANKILFTSSDSVGWKVMEMDLGSGRVRQVSKAPWDVDCFDAAYLPNGNIVFGSTANYQSVPCWHGIRRVSNLYVMKDDGSEMRRLCYDQDHDFHPAVLGNGQILFNRWDYTGIAHIYFRQQMVMNPDGTAQRAIYGSNSWFPNSIYFSREIPGSPGKLVSILSGYHGVPRMGQLVVIDTKKGWHEDDGLVARVSGKGEKITPKYYDDLVGKDWPKFATPFPLNEEYFLVSAWNEGTNSVGIYLADVFDNLVLIKELPGHALLEPIPVKSQVKPPVIPDKVSLSEDDATVYIHNVYAGPGLKGVPVGTIRKIRVIAYNFGFYGMAGPDKIGYGGPWEAMQIVGTVPVESDGSAMFKVPANMPIAFQPVDKEGRAIQLMRSWVTAMPGEFMSCVGCHEGPDEIAPSVYAQAAGKQPREIENWYGDPRGFDFEREVQPVLNKYCISCHNGENNSLPDLRPENFFADYQGKLLSDLGVARMHPVMKKETNGYNRYTPAYDALIPYIRRVGIEDEVNLLTPGEYHAGTSPLVQMLHKLHHGVSLNQEAWDRIYTWIDLNGPCHGTWNDVYPVQDGVCERRYELSVLHGGRAIDPETLPLTLRFDETPAERNSMKRPAALTLEGWPFSPEKARQQQNNLGEYEKEIVLENGVKIKLVKIPAGKFIMGDVRGFPDEWTEREAGIVKPFWMASCEITNAQFKAFDQEHNSRFYGKRHARPDDRGLPLNADDQPVLRVSWTDAEAFCKWLSDKTGMKFSLPSEARWEYACRAGTDSPLFYGDISDDFSPWANLGDKSFGPYLFKSGGVTHFVMDGADLADTTHNDHFVVTAPVGSFRPNNWGLYDMHGNVAEWVQEDAGNGEKLVRGGSFYDHPKRARSAYRLSYPGWQKVYNVGFRVVAEIEEFHVSH